MRLTRGSNSPLAKASISSANYLHIHANPPPSYGDKSACSHQPMGSGATPLRPGMRTLVRVGAP
jgi:hypothetical protein